MNICFCINDGYVDILKVCLFSILDNNQDEHIKFYIFSSFLSENSKEKLNELKEKFNNFDIEYHIINNDTFKNFKLNLDYISIETYYRYIIADILNNVDKILYLDADLIVNGSLKDLYNTNIENYYCAGIKDIYIEIIKHKYNIGLKEENTYINAGVLLLNLKELRKNNVSQQLVNKTLELKDSIHYQDQDIINIVFVGKIKLVDSIYNYTSSNMHKEWKKHKQAVIIHYTGPKKPWLPNCHNKLRKVWKEYYNRLNGFNKTNRFPMILFCIFLFILCIAYQIYRVIKLYH